MALTKFTYDNFFENKIDNLKSQGNYRQFADLMRQVGRFPKADYFDGNKSFEVTVWCSNDYLGMGQNSKVLDAIHNAIDLSGAGPGGTRNISGTNHYHVLLEKELAKLHKKESALLFSSGYVSNWATLSTLASNLPNCVVLSDSKNHASMIEGIRHSRANKIIFKHNDLLDLENHLARLDISQPKIIAFESLYSMDGDIAPISAICDLAGKYNSLTYLDEVHAVGLYGKHGGGISEQENVQDRVSIIEGTLAKGFGVFGGYITGSSLLCDFIRSFSSGFIFTSSLPPYVAAGALASIKYLTENSNERKLLFERVAYLRKKLGQARIPYYQNSSHIVPIIVGNSNLCKEISDRLLNNWKIYVTSINYPTVAVGTERLRVTPTPMHSEKDIDDFIYALSTVWQELVEKKQDENS